MFPTVNGKSFLDCQEEDLKEIIDNPTYMENEYLDYKDNFHVLECKNDIKQNAISEFRSDVCSFANSGGGFLVYGVSENGEGIPKELKGIIIENKDRFLLKIKDYLSGINPRIPNYKYNFVNLSNGSCIFVLFVFHDNYVPYIHLENNKNYIVYKRVGNSKMVVPYLEMKRMFNQSVSIEKEIEQFRRERIAYYKDNNLHNNDGRFVLIHLIPETFIDDNYNKNVFVMYKNGSEIYRLFKILDYQSLCYPMVDGAYYLNENGDEIRLYNNLVAEYCYPLKSHQSINEKILSLAWERHWNQICIFYSEYVAALKKLFGNERLFVCVSFVGCQGFKTDEDFITETVSTVDRNELIMPPVIIENINDQEELEMFPKKNRLNYLLSLGVRDTKEMKSLISELYGNDYC